jgi:hypothetical protein
MGKLKADLDRWRGRVRVAAQKPESEEIAGRDGRRGVAVIIVLGLLSLLMVLGVAFSITMRIERHGAGNYASDVGGKQRAMAGLARAIEAIETSIGESMYPTNDAFGSSGSSAAYLAYGEALELVPRVLHATAKGTSVAWESAGNGSCAYLVVNCSDALDLNFAGAEQRGPGTNVNEIQIGRFGAISDVAVFTADRASDVRYETVSEAELLNSGMDSSAPDDEFVFSTYSRYPEGFLLGGGTPDAAISTVPQVSLAGTDLDAPSRRSEIINALSSAILNCGPGDAEFVYTNLLDYVDEDCVPRHLKSACTERVPMINELKLERARLSRTSATECELRVQIIIEEAYPFASRVSHSFSVTGQVEMAVTPAGGAAITNAVSFGDDSGYLASGSGISYYQRNLTVISTFPSVAATNSFSVRLVGVSNFVNEVSGSYSAGTYVDAVEVDENCAELTLAQQVCVVANDGDRVDVQGTKSMEARDPRYNWFVGDNAGWRPAYNTADTLGAVNAWANRHFDSRKNGSRPHYEFSDLMHVSDRGFLVSVGELGSLLRKDTGGYWETIRLLNQSAAGAARDSLYRYLTVSTSTVARGQVNLNSKDGMILGAAFAEMPKMYPEWVDLLSPDDVTTIENLILDWRDAGNVFYNVDDLGELNWRTNAPSGDVFADRSDLELEGMMAYAAGLLGTRQNFFTIIFAEGTLAGGVGSKVTAGTGIIAGQRGVAQVWRDPFPSSNQAPKHNYFVRYFRWLED